MMREPEISTCKCKCHPVREVCRACCVRTALDDGFALMMKQNQTALDLQEKLKQSDAQSQEYKAAADLWATRWSRLKENFEKLELQNRELKEACEKAVDFLTFDQPNSRGSIGDVIAKLYRAINFVAEQRAGEIQKSQAIPLCPNCGLLSDGRKCRCGWIRG